MKRLARHSLPALQQLVADRRMLVNDPSSRARLSVRLVPWDRLGDLTVETETIRDPQLSPPYFVTAVTLTLPGLDGGSDAVLKGSDDRLRAAPGNGLHGFRCRVSAGRLRGPVAPADLPHVT